MAWPCSMGSRDVGGGLRGILQHSECALDGCHKAEGTIQCAGTWQRVWDSLVPCRAPTNMFCCTNMPSAWPVRTCCRGEVLHGRAAPEAQCTAKHCLGSGLHHKDGVALSSGRLSAIGNLRPCCWSHQALGVLPQEAQTIAYNVSWLVCMKISSCDSPTWPAPATAAPRPRCSSRRCRSCGRPPSRAHCGCAWASGRKARHKQLPAPGS